MYHPVNYLFAVVAADGYSERADHQFVVFDGLYFRDGDNEGLMYPDKRVAVQVLFYVFEGQQGHVFSFGGADGNVILQGLDVKDVFKQDSFVFVIALDE